MTWELFFKMKIMYLLLVAFTLIATPVFADELQEGINAHGRGDYEIAFKRLKSFADKGDAEA